MAQKYQYVDANDQLKTVEAASAEQARSMAKDIAKTSGLMLVPPKVDPKTSVDAGRIGKSSTPTVPTPAESGAVADAAYAIGSSMPGVQDAKNAAAAFATAAGPTETAYANILSSIQKDISGVAGKSARQAELMKSEGVNANRELLNQYTQDLEREQRNLKKTTDAIANGELGYMTSGFANKKIQDLQRQSLSRQADIAILANAAQGNIDTAMSLVDQKLQIEYGEKEDRIALQKQYLDLVAPLLSAEQKRVADQRAIEVGLYQDRLASERETARMEYQARLQRQNAAYQASLQPQDTGGSVLPAGSEGSDKFNLWASNVAGLTGGSTVKGRDKVIGDIANALTNGGPEAAANLMATRYIASRDKKEQDAIIGAEEALTQMRALEAFYARNPDFDINYFTKKMSDVGGVFGLKDPKVVEFLALRNELDSSLRVVDTGLSLTGFELQDSQQRYYSDTDNLDNYKTKTDALEKKLLTGLKSEFDRGIGTGFFDAYKSLRPWNKEESAGSSDPYDDFLSGQNL